jgi:chromosome segregation ATPase
MSTKEQLAAQEVAVAKQAGAVGMQEIAERANRLEQELAVAKTTATTAQSTADAAKATAAAAEQSRAALEKELAAALTQKTELEASSQGEPVELCFPQASSPAPSRVDSDACHSSPLMTLLRVVTWYRCPCVVSGRAAREASRAAEQKMLADLREKLVHYESQALSQESSQTETTNKLQAQVNAAQQAHKLLQENLNRATSTPFSPHNTHCTAFDKSAMIPTFSTRFAIARVLPCVLVVSGLAGAEERLSNAEADARTARDSAENARAEVATLMTKLGSAEEARAAAAAELATLRAQSVETVGSAESERAKVAQLTHELEIARAEADSRQKTAVDSLAAAHAEADAARARARELEEAVRQTKAVVETAAAEAGGEVQALRDSLDAKTAQYDSLHSQLQALNKEHRELEEKMAETELAAINSKDARYAILERCCSAVPPWAVLHRR